MLQANAIVGGFVGSNLIGPDRAGVVMKPKIRSLAGVVSDSRCSSVSSTDISLGHRRSDTAEIVAIKQVSVGIFAQRKHKLRRRSSRHIDDRRADTAKIGVAVIEM